MTLPTPPRTLHSRNKENNAQSSVSTRGVAWATHNQIHNLSISPSKLLRTPSSASRDRPARSILKKQSFTSIPLSGDICDEYKPREVTPEPADPLCNLTYLERPVTRIIASDAPLKDLIEAYNVLAARLRSSVTNTTDVDASWPLFQPIRKNKDTFVKAVVRDLGRALVDPLVGEGLCGESNEERILVPLPSPNNTPRKKKDGMTAEQVKYARDLCTVSHSAIRLLGVVWTLPAIYSIFSEEELGEILTQVLAIPLAPQLPTINARKTCALVVWLIQSQRLPRDVLAPAADRIAAALRRAIDGELGKEGKKGSVSDGLRAIHDLCAYQPVIFVKAFAPVLPFILQNLLASTLALRVQACQALGGIVAGANRAIVRKGLAHARFSRLVRLFLTHVPNKKKEQSNTQGTVVPSTPREPLIIRTLRLTLEATEPLHSAQGPVWALNVLANLIALLGPILIEDHALRRTVSSLLSLGLRHPKSSVRALTCIVWRPLVWAWFQPSFTLDIIWEDILENLQGEASLTEDERRLERKVARERDIEMGKDSFWKLLTSVVECQTGIVTIAALLGADSSNDDYEGGKQAHMDDNIRRVFSLLKLMIAKGGATCQDAAEVIKQLVNFEQPSEQWHVNMLLPRSLFSATSNLLSVEFKSLSTTVRSALERSVGLEVIKSLTREDLAKDWVFEGVIEVWKEVVSSLEIMDGGKSPATDILDPWDALIKANVGYSQDAGDDAATIACTVRAADILIDIIQDQNIDLTPKVSVSSSSVKAPEMDSDTLPIILSSDPVQEDWTSIIRSTNGGLKLKLVRDLWATVRTVVPHSLLASASEKLLLGLIRNEDDLVGGGDVLDFDSESDDTAFKLWAQLCAELITSCDIDIMKAFWGHENNAELELGKWNRALNKMAVWRVFVELWKDESSCPWESSVVLLIAPFMNADIESSSDDDNGTWESLLDNTMSKALDYGLDSTTVLEEVASSLVDAHDWDMACNPSLVRATDALLSRLELGDLREPPSSLLRLVEDVLGATYPPSPPVKQYARWVLRTISDLVRKCDNKEMANSTVTAVKESVSMWILDEMQVMDDEEWIYDMEPLYGYLLSALKLLPKTVETLYEFLPILESALSGNEFRTSLAAEAFREFWDGCSEIVEPQEGWPAGLVKCLVCSGQRRETSTTGLKEDVTGQAFVLIPPSSPSTLCDDATGEQDSDSSTISQPSTPTHKDKDKLFSELSTPSSSRHRGPPLLQASSPVFSVPPPLSPLSSPTWVALKNKVTGARKRLRTIVENKENNVFPSLPSPSIRSSIPAGGPVTQPTTPKKRKLEGDLDRCDEKSLSPTKRNRSDSVLSHSTNAAYTDDTDEEDYVVASLLASRSSDEPTVGTTRKRKRMTMIMEAVEVPPVKLITMSYKLNLRKSHSTSSAGKQNPSHKSNTSTSRLRRAKSDSLRGLPKRADSEHDHDDLFGSLPLPGLLSSYKRSMTAGGKSIPDRASRDLSPPSSPTPRSQLVLKPLVDDSENEDDPPESSSPLKSARLRRMRWTQSQVPNKIIV
ncbi:hypothetical protein AX15_003157 [Amanita polypyramis BW_CC]|nr:hypothetical protein AX15_003157 [Amanita polypyramis BW_CC]